MTKSLGKPLEPYLSKLIETLLPICLNHYGDRLITLAVYGSVARGTHHETSDLDLLLIVEKLPKGRMKRQEEFEAVEDSLWRALGVQDQAHEPLFISVLIKSPQEALAGSPLFLDMIEDAWLLFDRDDFFKNILARLQERLKLLGAKRVWLDGAWYWDLKPDYKPGEVFEL